MRSPRSSLDLLAAIALAMAGLAAVLIPLDVWLRAVLWVPLVLGVPGYAILAALFPDGRLQPGERVVYAVAASIAATALGGIVVQIVLDLDRTVWAVLLVAITVVAALVAIRRRDRSSADASGSASAGPRLHLPGPVSGLILIAAVVVAAAAVVISSNGARRERDSYRFTALWVQPARQSDAAGGRAVTVGVDNHQGATARYRLVVKQGGGILTRRRLELGDGGRWRLRLAVAPPSAADPVTATLRRDGTIYRHVYLDTGSTP
ncbi:MAG TPA: DUF1616 domain-containing protein [Solirubrobacterales bacterium]|jgi:uncharacterized membrane protein|nr:DUF1616 domain-containing protein [Solirubrobacterales bacterium]